MKVAINAMLLRPPYTGVQRYVTGLIGAIASHVPEVETKVYLGRGHGWSGAGLRGVAVRDVAVKSSRRLLRICWEQFVLPFSLRRSDADVFHALGYVMPVLASLIGRRPTVLTVHDVTALEKPDLVSSLNALHYGITLPVSLKLARRIIVPTRAVADRLLERSVPASRVEVIPWGVDDRFFASSERKNDARIVKKYAVRGRYVLHVGRLEPKKNLENLIKAFFAFKMDTSLPHTLVLAGPPGPSAKKVQRLIESLRATSSVVLTGHVDDDDLPSLYRKADLVVCPSLEEGFGFPPLEALACGTAVITSRIPPFVETLGDDVPMFDPTDLSGLRETMTAVLRDESARKDIAAAGRKTASRYTWERCARSTFDVYRNLKPL